MSSNNPNVAEDDTKPVEIIALPKKDRRDEEGTMSPLFDIDRPNAETHDDVQVATAAMAQVFIFQLQCNWKYKCQIVLL